MNLLSLKEKKPIVQGVGKRKEATAEVFVLEKKQDKPIFLVAHRDTKKYEDAKTYFNYSQTKIRRALEPAIETMTVEKYDFICRVKGGGKSAQADAIRLGIARALLKIDIGLKPIIKAGNYDTRDARAKERNKVGKHGARRAKQSPIR